MEDQSSEYGKIRQNFREQTVSHRKYERFKLVASKRSGMEDNEYEENSISTSDIQGIAETVRKEGNAHNLNQLKKLFARGEDYTSAFLRVNGALPSLVALLLSKDVSVAVEACKCLTNIAAGNHKANQAIIKAAAPYLIFFLEGSTTVLQNHSAWTLGNMAADCNICRRRLKDQGLLPALLHLLDTSQKNLSESVTFALSVYTKFEESDSVFLCEEGILEKLLSFMDDPELQEPTLFNIFCIFFHLTANSNVADHFLNSGIVKKITQIYSDQCFRKPVNVVLVTPLLRCIGNLCTGPNKLVENVCSFPKFINACVCSLQSPYLHIRKEVLWLLGNIAASSSLQLDVLSIVLPHIKEVLSVNIQANIISEALRFVTIAKYRFEENGFDITSPELTSCEDCLNCSKGNYALEINNQCCTNPLL